MSKACNKHDNFSINKSEIFKLALSIIITIIVCCICVIPGAHHAIGVLLSSTIFSFLANSVSVSYEVLVANFYANIVLLLLTIPVQFYCGFRFLAGTKSAIKNRKLNMNVLVFVGTMIAFLMSLYITFEPFILNMWFPEMTVYTNSGMPFYETSCMLVTFIFLGQVLEDYASSKTNKSIEALMNLVPAHALKLIGFNKEMLNKNEISLDDLRKLNDVWLQETDIDSIEENDYVFIGEGQSIPVDGIVVAGNSKVDQSMITGESELIEMFEGEYVTGGTVNVKGNIVVSTTHTLENSVLSKIIDAVRTSQNTKAPVARIADKVAGVFIPTILLCALASFVGWLIFGFFTNGMHLTTNVVTHALMCGVSVSVVSCACALGLATPTALTVGMGKGASLGVIIKDGEVLETMCNVGHIVFDKTGTLTLSGLDKNANAAKIVRPEAKETLSLLRDKYNIKTYMISGDVCQEAYRVSDELGFERDNVECEVMPVDKKTFVQGLVDSIKSNSSIKNSKSKLSKVAFVGDGINDAPALASADIGITLESGTDIALDTGSVVLMHNKLSDIIVAIRLSKRTMQKIKQNLFWALFYNVFMIPLAAFGILLPGVAAFCHAISSILVILNSLTLRRFK